MADGIKIDYRKLNRLSVHPKMQALLTHAAQQIAQACGEGYVGVASTTYHKRARAAVIAVTHEARHDNKKNNTMLRSIDAGRP